MSSSDTTGAAWRKSTYSTAQGSCVEAGSIPGHVLIRDTTQKHGDGTVVSVSVSVAAWRRFTVTIASA